MHGFLPERSEHICIAGACQGLPSALLPGGQGLLLLLGVCGFWAPGLCTARKPGCAVT